MDVIIYAYLYLNLTLSVKGTQEMILKMVPVKVILVQEHS